MHVSPQCFECFEALLSTIIQQDDAEMIMMLDDALWSCFAVPKCFRNTGVLQPSPLIKISSRDLGYAPFIIKILIGFL
jgi:hypothetical protein